MMRSMRSADAERIGAIPERRARARAQMLHRPGVATPVDVVRHLLAVQAQSLPAARLALRARAPGLVADDVGPGLVRTWLMRGTLHLVAAEDWPWLHALTAPRQETANARRLAQLGAAPEDAGALVRLLGDEGPLTREEIAARTPEGLPLPHLLWRCAIRGEVVMEGERFVRVEPPEPVDRRRALAELGARYVRSHGPADARDLAAWSGLPLGDARAALDGVEPSPANEAEPLGPRLLPMYDEYLLGWKDRSFAVPAELARRVHPGGGILRATATVDGLAVGTWSAQGLDVPDPSLFAAELADVERFRAART